MADARLSEIGGKGLFVKEIEDALLAGTIDLAVHSSKDMPARLPDGLEVRATLPREDPRDALVLPAPAASLPFDEAVRRLGASPRVGTSSVRRVAQLTALLPACRASCPSAATSTRGCASSIRATWTRSSWPRRAFGAWSRPARITAFVPADACVPAPGQGIVAVETRVGDAATAGLVERIGDADALDALHGRARGGGRPRRRLPDADRRPCDHQQAIGLRWPAW